MAEGELAARHQRGRLSGHFAAARIRVADGPAQQIGGRPAQHLPGEARQRRCRGVVGERRASGETKYYLSNLPSEVSLKTLAATIKARWACEQAHQQLKEELGLDHFEGRSWTGLHRHALMTTLAYAFLQNRRLAAAGRGAARRGGAGRGGAGEKGALDPRRSRACPPSAPPSSARSCAHGHRLDARTAEVGSACRLIPTCQSSARRRLRRRSIRLAMDYPVHA
jgi:hypothetical protein